MTLRQTPLQVLLLQCETEETLQRDNKAVAFTTEQSSLGPAPYHYDIVRIHEWHEL